MFINLSNHPSASWPEEERKEASAYGRIIDLRFPDIPPDCSSEEIDQCVGDYFYKIQELVLDPQKDAVMVQGEFVFTYRMVNCLKENGINAVSAVTERHAAEKALPDGTVRKVSYFAFKGFRKY